MANHRYWRIRASQVQSGGANFALATLEMRATAGGADQCTGGTPIYSSQFDAITTTSGHAASNAFDGNVNTRWASANSSAGVYWIGYDFGTAVDVQEVRLVARNDASFTQGPTGFFIEWSDNNVDWTTVRQHINIAAWSAGLSRLFANVALAALPAVYWRLRAHNTYDGGPYFALGEVEMRATVGGADECAGGTVLKSSEFSAGAEAAANAFDNSNATEWASAASTPGNVGCAWIGYQLPAAKSIAEVVLTARNDANYPQGPTSFSLCFSHDGNNWEEYKLYGCGFWGVSVAQTFSGTGDLNITKAAIQVASSDGNWLDIRKATLQVASILPSPYIKVTKAALQVISLDRFNIQIQKAVLQVASLEPTYIKVSKAAFHLISKPEGADQPPVFMLW